MHYLYPSWGSGRRQISKEIESLASAFLRTRSSSFFSSWWQSDQRRRDPGNLPSTGPVRQCVWRRRLWPLVERFTTGTLRQILLAYPGTPHRASGNRQAWRWSKFKSSTRCHPTSVRHMMVRCSGCSVRRSVGRSRSSLNWLCERTVSPRWMVMDSWWACDFQRYHQQ